MHIGIQGGKMGEYERRDKEKKIRRDDIIDAAEKVIFSKGYELATMDEISKQAEYSKRTVYMYFNSKEQLYFEIMIRGYKLLVDLLETSLPIRNGHNAIERLRHIGKILYQFNTDYPDYFDAIMCYENGEKDFLIGIPDSSREECYALGEQIFGYLDTVLTEGIEEGSVKSELDVVSTAIILWSCTIGLFNIAIKKRNYIEQYHKRDPQKILLEGFQMIISSIEKNDGKKEKNEKEK
jgi:AcrR family transcriptional regulator